MTRLEPLLATLLFLGGCSLFGARPCEDDVNCPDLGECRGGFCVPPPDPDPGRDAGPPPPDAGPPLPPLDAGAPVDAGTPVDAGPPVDAGARPDAGPPDAGPGAPWHDLGLARRARVTLANPLPFPVERIPVLLTLEQEVADAIVEPGSIRVYPADGTEQLPYEIDSVGKLWVLVDDFAGSGARELFLYFNDDGGAAPRLNPSQVWADDHAVYHLVGLQNSAFPAESLVAGSDEQRPTPIADGAIGGAVHFDGDDMVTHALPTAHPLVSTGALTLELWVRLEEIGIGSQFDNAFATIVNADAAYAHYLCLDPTAGQLYLFASDDADATEALRSSSVSLGLGVWRHVAVVRDALDVHFYLDGVEVGFVSRDAPLGAISGGATFALGNDPPAPGSGVSLRGDLDEVRVSSRVRTAEEIRARFTFSRDYDGAAYGAVEDRP